MENCILFTLPHAGGSTRTYVGWDKEIDCRVFNIEYPGHWSKMREPLLQSFEELAEYVLNVILKETTENTHILIFGHSLGAIISWYIAHDIINCKRSIETLFLSGSQNPESFPEDNIRSLSDDEDIIGLVEYDYDKYSDKINNQFKNFFLPLLKNDLNICRSYKYKNKFVDINSIVLFGKDDCFTDLTEVKKWSKYVSCKEFIEMSGKHLFIEDNENKKILFNMINDELKKVK